MKKIIEIKKDMKLVSEGTDNILIGLSEEDKKFALIRTSELYLKNDSDINIRILDGLNMLFRVKTKIMLTTINNLIKYYYNNIPIGYRRVDGFPHIICNKEGDLLYFNRRPVKLCYNNKGYLYCSLLNKTKLVHRLIALTWIPNPDNKPQVNHIDGNKTNNKVENLEWVTGLENMQHATMTGLRDTEKMKLNGNGEKNSQAVLTLDNVKEMRKIYSDTLLQAKISIAKTFDIPVTLVNEVILGTNERPVPPIFKYRSFESKLKPGKIYTVKRKIYSNPDVTIRGMFINSRRKVIKHLTNKFKMSRGTIYDVLSRRSWNYDYC